MADKVRRDVRQASADSQWIKMIIPGSEPPSAAPTVMAGTAVAGTVALWTHDTDGEPISEIGWMVLREYQGRGLAKRAVRALLELAHEDGRWGLVHAFPGTANGPSNGICRSLGFTFVGERDTAFGDRILRTNHWTIDPARLRPAGSGPGSQPET